MLKYTARERDGFFNGFVGVDGVDDVSAGAYLMVVGGREDCCIAVRLRHAK